MGVRVEVTTAGTDESLQGLSSDPYGARLGQWTGLRIPSLRVDDTTRYLFLLATRKVDKPTRIRGLRQLLTLGAFISTGGETPTPLPTPEFAVTTPGFKSFDGNVSWHLVSEPNVRPPMTVPAGRGRVESPNFAFRSTDSPALLFESAAFGGGTGQTLYYPQNITDYAPPTVGTVEWQPLGGLGNMHEIRFPWDSSHAWDSLDIPICAQSSRRISLYASVLQTTGVPTITTTTTGPSRLPPETEYANAMAGVADVSPVLFWRVAGAIIFEDYDCECGGEDVG